MHLASAQQPENQDSYHNKSSAMLLLAGAQFAGSVFVASFENFCAMVLLIQKQTCCSFCIWNLQHCRTQMLLQYRGCVYPASGSGPQGSFKPCPACRRRNNLLVLEGLQQALILLRNLMHKDQILSLTIRVLML